MSWIITATGKKFDPINPDPGLIDIHDIAHALSNTCRFNGHSRAFYSVAQHSFMASLIVPGEWALHALLHDATEAYISDVTRPIKPHLINYAEIEHNLWQAIAERFGLDPDMPPEIKEADRRLLATERRDLMPHHPDPWPVLEGVAPLEQRIVPMYPHIAKQIFMDRYNHLDLMRFAA